MNMEFNESLAEQTCSGCGRRVREYEGVVDARTVPGAAFDLFDDDGSTSDRVVLCAACFNTPGTYHRVWALVSASADRRECRAPEGP